MSLSVVPFSLFCRCPSLLERLRSASSALFRLNLPVWRSNLFVRPVQRRPGPQFSRPTKSFFEAFFDRLLHRVVDQFFHRFSVDFLMLCRSTSQWIFDRSVERFFVRSKTQEFEKSLRNIAHAHKNRCFTIMGRSTCFDAFPRKRSSTSRKTNEKSNENRTKNKPPNDRKIIGKCPEKRNRIDGRTFPCASCAKKRSQDIPKVSKERPGAFRDIHILGGTCFKQGKGGTREDSLRAQRRALKIYLYRRGSASPDRRKTGRQVAKIAL